MSSVCSTADGAHPGSLPEGRYRTIPVYGLLAAESSRRLCACSLRHRHLLVHPPLSREQTLPVSAARAGEQTDLRHFSLAGPHRQALQPAGDEGEEALWLRDVRAQAASDARLDVDRFDLLFLAQSVFKLKCVFTNKPISASKLVFTRWDPAKPASLNNLILATSEEARKHEEEKLEGMDQGVVRIGGGSEESESGFNGFWTNSPLSKQGISVTSKGVWNKTRYCTTDI